MVAQPSALCRKESGSPGATTRAGERALMFLGCVAAAGLGLNLLGLAVYLSCLCCCRRDEEDQSKKAGSCCVTWSAVAAALLTW
ncbi:hypothetical protein D4764_01G0020500 [Takifugu flavidus]|uniref:Protein tweety homolog n=1 Tax=Takifugu flavidus TaxID=433684 RepID=A0A5C6PRV6_9TELE|nr:hypothetical protein D4764_01G0020500 [Takifugu flavidus]